MYLSTMLIFVSFSNCSLNVNLHFNMLTVENLFSRFNLLLRAIIFCQVSCKKFAFVMLGLQTIDQRNVIAYYNSLDIPIDAIQHLPTLFCRYVTLINTFTNAYVFDNSSTCKKPTRNYKQLAIRTPELGKKQLTLGSNYKKNLKN